MSTLLATDAYKFSMAEAGWPLRSETFYYTHRRGGPHYLPVDVAAFVRSRLPAVRSEDYARLAACGYPMGTAFREAMARADRLAIRALPAGSWFFDREPVFSVTGPSAVVSWLEPTLLQLHYRIQVATSALVAREHLPRLVGRVTCVHQRELVRETLDLVGVRAPRIDVHGEGYYQSVRERVRRLVAVLDDPARIFEVGMRAASCSQQHEIALQACRDEGVLATSNVELAVQLGLRAVGTMGHEHVQRYGDDEAAFRGMRDRFPGPVSYLLDTFSTLRSGLPAAYRLIAEEPGGRGAIRFDSGDKEAQYRAAVAEARRRGIGPTFVLEDGFDEAMTGRFEALRRELGVPPSRQLYGYGDYLVRAPWDALSRSRVSAVWKLSCSAGAPTMKFGDEDRGGKESIPGLPTLWCVPTGRRWRGLVAQEGEQVRGNAVRLTGEKPRELRARLPAPNAPSLSPETRRLIGHLRRQRDRHIRELEESERCLLKKLAA